jgi:hypothetical protein
VYEELVDDHFKMSEQLRDGAGPHTHCYFKQGKHEPWLWHHSCCHLA